MITSESTLKARRVKKTSGILEFGGEVKTIKVSWGKRGDEM